MTITQDQLAEVVAAGQYFMQQCQGMNAILTEALQQNPDNLPLAMLATQLGTTGPQDFEHARVLDRAEVRIELTQATNARRRRKRQGRRAPGPGQE